MHAPHHALPDFHEETVLHDGCEECEARAAAGLAGLHSIDATNTLKLWQLMRAIKWSGGAGVDRHVSTADARMTGTLYSIGVFLERAGIDPDEIEGRMFKRVAHEQAELERIFGA